MARVMIFDGASAKSQRVIASHGGPTNSEMFERALSLHKHGLELFSLNVADGERLLQGVALSDFDGIVITGSPLSVYKTRPEVTRQIELAREAFECGVPMYGSCWGLQLMTAALGGVVRLNPRGREIGIARNIAPNEAGGAHFLFSGKPKAFDALCSHEDDVATLPPGAVALASNGVSDVQAVDISRGSSHFVGVQYHPSIPLRQRRPSSRRGKSDWSPRAWRSQPRACTPSLPICARLRAIPPDGTSRGSLGSTNKY